MCLLKVYLTEGGTSKKLIAEEIALVTKSSGNITLKNLKFEEKTLSNVEIVLIDTLNSFLLLKRRNKT
ncbi:CooT family nickel-binding protein [Candidatus Bathyarchaeota archaeon]|nr:MAG: CooT family nickel-binding protein [Candidatus Bathyarchaeota archaeon]HDO72577.1 CooT family nickel-binding protein [Candidatus Bathyarchaeota archaeon]HEX69585.1 CooT family nickel-binding protein [Candidatus Bathyarchaeota archaeon]